MPDPGLKAWHQTIRTARTWVASHVQIRRALRSVSWICRSNRWNTTGATAREHASVLRHVVEQ